MTKRSNPGYIIFIILVILLFGIGFCRVVYAQENIELVKQKWLIEQYDKYVKECYADSQLISKHLPIVGMNCYYYSPGDGKCKNPKHFEEIWTHKEPTFKGFIEWSRKQ